MVLEHVHISHVSKTGNLIPSVGFPPGQTCRPDAPCLPKCYARKGRFAFSHNKNLLQRNLSIWKEDPEFFRREIILASFPARFFRWFPSGDIPDPNFLQMMVDVYHDVPGTRFLAFTKKHELVNDYLDRNPMWDQEHLVIALSAWGDDYHFDNPHNLPVAYIKFKNKPCTIPENAWQCPKFCGDCVFSHRSCWDMRCGDCVVFDEH